MGNALRDFGAKFKGGTRRHTFQVNCPVPGGAAIEEYHAFAFALPASIINEIAVPYRGRNLYIPGDRDYQPFTLTIMDDNGDYNYWSRLMTWQRRLNDHENNVSETGAAADRQNWTLKHIDYYTGNKVSKEITMVGCWPISVGPVVLSSGSKNEFVTYDVTVRYDYLKLGPETSVPGSSVSLGQVGG